MTSSRRLLICLGFFSILVWLFLERRLPVALSPYRAGMAVIEIDGAKLPASEVERAWMSEESRILATHPGCEIDWSMTGRRQVIRLSGEVDDTIISEIKSWAAGIFPDASLTELIPRGPILPYFDILIPATDYLKTALQTDRVLIPEILSIEQVTGASLQPPLERTLWIRLDPWKTVQAGVSISEIKNALATVPTSIGPFIFQGKEQVLHAALPSTVGEILLRGGTTPIRLRDIAELIPSVDLHGPSVYIDGKAFVVVRVETKIDANHRALFDEIRARLEPSGIAGELIFEMGAEPQAAVRGILWAVVIVLAASALVLRWSGIGGGQIAAISSALLAGSVAWPLFAFAALGFASIESICGWALGLALAQIALIKAACSRSSELPSLRSLLIASIQPALLVGAAAVAVAILFDIPALLAAEGFVALMMTACVTCALGHAALGSFRPRPSAVTTAILHIRHAFQRRHAPAAVLLLAYAACLFLSEFGQIGQEEVRERTGEQNLYIRFTADERDLPGLTPRLAAIPDLPTWKLTHSPPTWLLKCRIGGKDPQAEALAISRALGTVPGLRAIAQVSEIEALRRAPILRGMPIRREEPGDSATIWFDVTHHDRLTMLSQCDRLTKQIRAMTGVESAGYESALVASTFELRPRSPATASLSGEAMSMLDAAHPDGLNLGEVLLDGTPVALRLSTQGDEKGGTRELEALMRTPVGQIAGALVTAGDVLELHSVELPQTLKRRNGKAFDPVEVLLRGSGDEASDWERRDAMARSLAEIAGGGTEIIVRGRYLNGKQAILGALALALVAALLGAAFIARSHMRPATVRAFGAVAVLFGSASAYQFISRTPQWNTQTILLMASCVMLFLAASRGGRRPSGALAGETILCAAVIPFAISLTSLPIENAGFLTLLAASLALGQIWSVLSPESIPMSMRRATRARIRGTDDTLEVRNITHVYEANEPVVALSRVSISAGEGVFGLLGPNGAGKTTLWRILAGELRPARGAAVIGEIDVLADSHRGHIGMVPQRSGGYESLSVREYLEYMARLSGAAAVEKAVASTGLTEYLGKRVRDLSGGYLKRLDIARALSGDPQLLILDEPTSGLDPEVRMPLRNLISELGRGRIVLFATHLVEDVESVCDTIAIIDHGKVLYQGSTRTCVDRFRDRVYSAVVSNEERLEFQRGGHRIVTQRKDEQGWAIRFVVDGARPIGGARIEEPRLEDAYVALVGSLRRERLVWAE